jgi:cytochrome oxidase Cu insertion factor (SCO1/SenC/PrrC family)
MSEQEPKQAATHFRTKIILLAIIFLLPISYAVYLKITDWHPTETTNYGDLVTPALPLNDVRMKTLDGKQVGLEDFAHHWLLVTFAGSTCDSACEKNIYKMRQTHIAQGKYQMRVKRLLVLPAGTRPKDNAMFEQYPGMVVVTGPAEAIKAFGAQFKTASGTALDGLNQIYLVDPLGNFMMVYGADADAGGIRKDLGRLLRVSRIG